MSKSEGNTSFLTVAMLLCGIVLGVFLSKITNKDIFKQGENYKRDTHELIQELSIISNSNDSLSVVVNTEKYEMLKDFVGRFKRLYDSFKQNYSVLQKKTEKLIIIDKDLEYIQADLVSIDEQIKSVNHLYMYFDVLNGSLPILQLDLGDLQTKLVALGDFENSLIVSNQVLLVEKMIGVVTKLKSYNPNEPDNFAANSNELSMYSREIHKTLEYLNYDHLNNKQVITDPEAKKILLDVIDNYEIYKTFIDDVLYSLSDLFQFRGYVVAIDNNLKNIDAVLLTLLL